MPKRIFFHPLDYHTILADDSFTYGPFIEFSVDIIDDLLLPNGNDTR